MWIIVLIVIIAALIAVIYHDTHNFKIYEYEVSTDKVSGNYTFVFLTDLHNYVFGKDNERLIEAIDKIHPDAILSGGDMFTAHTRDGRFHPEIAFSLLKNLSDRYPLYISNGNHEEKIKESSKLFGNAFERYKNSLKREGIVYLDNESADYNGVEIGYFQITVNVGGECRIHRENLKGIGDGYRIEDGLQIMVAVGTLLHDIESEVDLRIGECDHGRWGFL